MQSFDSNTRFVYLRAKGAFALVYFLAKYFLYTVARIARTHSLYFVNITKDKPPFRQNVPLRESINHVYFDLLAYLL